MKNNENTSACVFNYYQNFNHKERVLYIKSFDNGPVNFVELNSVTLSGIMRRLHLHCVCTDNCFNVRIIVRIIIVRIYIFILPLYSSYIPK